MATVDEHRFRAAMSRLPTGVTILSTLGAAPPRAGAGSDGGDTHEVMTASAVTSVSLDPTLLLASVARSSRWLAAVRSAGVFAVNVLGAQHEALARWCADRSRHDQPDLLRQQHPVRASPTSGVLLFDEALVVAECRVYAEHPAGDHVLVVGEVTDLHVHEVAGPPLVFHNRGYATLPAHGGHLHSVDGSPVAPGVYPPDLEVPAAAASG